MPGFKLDPSLSVGEETIDRQHAGLISKISEIEGILSSLEVDMGSLRKANQFLFDYVKGHLSYEEAYMKRIGYPGLENHTKVHKKFTDFLMEFQVEFREKYSSGKFSSIEIAGLLKKIRDYLKMWIEHIRIDDQKYAAWSRKNE
jgi:hemerythrin